MRLLLVAALAACSVQIAHATEAPALIKSTIFIEKENLANRSYTRTVERASTLGAGDRVVTILDWRAPTGREAATVNLAIPRHLAFQRSSIGGEDVSIDGGRSWGKLGMLQVRQGGSVRLASLEDVTNVRWRVRGAYGRITYSALVR